MQFKLFIIERSKVTEAVTHYIWLLLIILKTALIKNTGIMTEGRSNAIHPLAPRHFFRQSKEPRGRRLLSIPQSTAALMCHKAAVRLSQRLHGLLDNKNIFIDTNTRAHTHSTHAQHTLMSSGQFSWKLYLNIPGTNFCVDFAVICPTAACLWCSW